MEQEKTVMTVEQVQSKIYICTDKVKKIAGILDNKHLELEALTMQSNILQQEVQYLQKLLEDNNTPKEGVTIPTEG